MEGGRICLKKEKNWLLLNIGPGVKGELHNLAVNPTPGSEGGNAAWESFRDTGCRDVSRANCPVLVSCSVWLHAERLNQEILWFITLSIYLLFFIPALMQMSHYLFQWMNNKIKPDSLLENKYMNSLFFPIFWHLYILLRWRMIILKVSDNEVGTCTSNSCEPKAQTSNCFYFSALGSVWH